MEGLTGKSLTGHFELILCYFPESTALLAEIDDYTHPPALCAADTFLDGIYKVRFARAYI
jgi:hypothetical protein